MIPTRTHVQQSLPVREIKDVCLPVRGWTKAWRKPDCIWNKKTWVALLTRWSLDPCVPQPPRAAYPVSSCPFFLSKGRWGDVPSYVWPCGSCWEGPPSKSPFPAYCCLGCGRRAGVLGLERQRKRARAPRPPEGPTTVMPKPPSGPRWSQLWEGGWRALHLGGLIVH